MKTLTALLTAGCLAAAGVGYSPDSAAQMRIWGTYYGGNLDDMANKVAVDGAGNIYVAGRTSSATKISSPGSFDSTLTGESNGYLAKFSPTGARLWATYYGDAPYTSVNAIGVDRSGNVYIAGEVDCGPFLPTLATPQAQDKVCQELEVFLAKFDSNGQRIWGTYFGGEADDYAGNIVVNSAGEIYLSGTTFSTQGVASNPSQDSTLAGHADTFIAKFNTNGQKIWGRYFGAEDGDFNFDMACRALLVGFPETCYITGVTSSATGIATATAHDKILSGNRDAYIARIQGSNGQLLWSTYYGGNGGGDIGRGLAIDKSLNVYVGGGTTSTDAMVTDGAFDLSFNGGDRDMFLAKFSSSGQRLAGTYIGNTKFDEVVNLAIDTSNNLYVIGKVEGAGGGVVTPNAFDTSYGGGTNDAVLMKFSPTLQRTWSTYYGGNEKDQFFIGGIAVDKNNRIYMSGQSTSTNGISTQNGHQPVKSGLSDAYIVLFEQ